MDLFLASKLWMRWPFKVRLCQISKIKNVFKKMVANFFCEFRKGGGICLCMNKEQGKCTSVDLVSP